MSVELTAERFSSIAEFLRAMTAATEKYDVLIDGEYDGYARITVDDLIVGRVRWNADRGYVLEVNL